MDKNNSSGVIDLGLSVFGQIWDWTADHDAWRLAVVFIICAAVVFWSLATLLTAFGKALEGGAKLFESIGVNKFPRLMNREERARIRKRSQFCSVLEADLTSIAKAESWNDQYFTDLEAEVETEGGYYKTWFHRFFGRPSSGLRKEKSLIGAISSSSERAIQLTGEPGSGKSVALRHLASQLAARAKVSKNKHVLVPLYVNLREITVPADVAISSDMIRDFVLDNIRRGDSDTTAYVRENWADYRERGVWFFLFDSFDEIPAILHAEKGSPVTREYSEAIRMFLEGMGACRGILASREFKGPEALPWKKFRILRLSLEKQHELVGNAFLSQTQERTVLRHIATNQSVVANTPLFLTLLCRYVKDSSVAPKNDYELLSLQIDRLARRDPHYLKRVYELTPEELLRGAQRMARLFAEEASLGLAPTIDQVESVLSQNEIPGGNIQRFVAAMVDSKIARADVANAAPGDRRFAFSHRRYQEALFVRHLVQERGYISGINLLTDPRWREYAVTLLETQPVEALNEMFEAAEGVLKEAVLSQRRTDAVGPLASYCGYFDWNEEASQMLSLLQEGLARRVGLIPSELSNQVEKFLKVRWDQGDSFDRVRVMQVASLLPQKILESYLEETFSNGSEKAQYEAFKQAASLVGSVSVAVRKAVLNHLSEEILSAKNSSAILRVEALIARLPPEFGAWYVLRRCEFLWGVSFFINNYLGASAWTGIAETILTSGRKSDRGGSFKVYLTLVYGSVFVVSAFVLSVMSWKLGFAAANLRVWVEGMHNQDHVVFLKHAYSGLLKSPTFVVFVAAFTGLVLCLPLILKFKSVGEPIGLRYLLGSIFNTKKFLSFIFEGLIVLLSIGFVFGLVYLVGAAFSYSMSFLFGVVFDLHTIVVGFLVMTFVGVAFIFATEVRDRMNRRSSRLDFDSLVENYGGRAYEALLQSSGWLQFVHWLSFWVEMINLAGLDERTSDELRSISAVLQGVQRGDLLKIDSAPIFSESLDKRVLMMSINDIEQLIDDTLISRHPVPSGEGASLKALT